MPKGQILRNSWSLGATVTSPNEETDIRARASTMVNNYRTSLRWKTTSLTSVQATFDAGSSKPWDTLFLGYHNGTGTGTISIKADDVLANLDTTPDYTPAAEPIRHPGSREYIDWHYWHETDEPKQHRYIRIEISDATNPAGFFTAAICFIGSRFVPEGNVDIGDSLTHDDLSVTTDMMNGESVTRRRVRKKGQEVNWESLGTDDAMTFDNLLDTYGHSTPIVFRKEPDKIQYGMNMLIFCRIISHRGPTRFVPYGVTNTEGATITPMYSMQLGVKEV